MCLNNCENVLLLLYSHKSILLSMKICILYMSIMFTNNLAITNGYNSQPLTNCKHNKGINMFLSFYRYNTKEENGQTRDPTCITSLRVS